MPLPTNITATDGTSSLAYSEGQRTAVSSLNAATTGNGLTVDFGAASNAIAFAVTVAGTITGGAVQFQVSVDNVTWFTVPSASLTSFTGTAANPFTLPAGPGPVALFVCQNTAFRYARANVSSNVTGGGTVSVMITAF